MKTLADIRQVKATLPPRLLLHGQEGVGKTTLATAFPEPIFLQAEEGTPGNLELASFGALEDLGNVRDAIAALGSEPHNYRTLVLDSVDALEPLVWSAVCREHPATGEASSRPTRRGVTCWLVSTGCAAPAA